MMTVDTAQFNRDIDQVRRETGRSSEEMLKYVMTLMLQTGVAETKLGKKNRSLVKTESEPERDADANPEEKRFFRVFRQSSFAPRKVFVPVIPRNSKKNTAAREAAIRARDAIVAKFKKIRYQGVARASWRVAIGIVQSARVSLDGVPQTRKGLVSVVKSMSGNRPYIEVTNHLEWISKIALNLEQHMMAKADMKLIRSLDRITQKAIDRAERRAA